MFSTGSPYSPFFTSGLLSAQLMAMDTPSSSRPSSQEFSLVPRRGSLPTDNLATRSPPATQDESAAFYFTMQPKRDESEFRSFLSLDLAESQSMRSASLKRKASRSRSSKPNATISHIPEVPRLVVPRRVPSPASLRMRRSRDSIRAMPSPKPAPSMTLPELPKEASTSRSATPNAPPRLPSIGRASTIDFTFPPAAFSPVKSSFLPSLRISRSKAPKSVVRLPANRSSILSHAPTSSSVSTRVKRVNRSDALARLEGRVKPAPIATNSIRSRRNFMNMSDDEDDGSDIDCLSPNSEYSDLGDDLFYAFFEPEDVVLPASVPSSPISMSPISTVATRRLSSSPTKSSFPRRKHSRRSTKDWFPLTSFIDLKNDDESSTWSWRSFIDVANLS